MQCLGKTADRVLVQVAFERPSECFGDAVVGSVGEVVVAKALEDSDFGSLRVVGLEPVEVFQYVISSDQIVVHRYEEVNRYVNFVVVVLVAEGLLSSIDLHVLLFATVIIRLESLISILLEELPRKVRGKAELDHRLNHSCTFDEIATAADYFAAHILADVASKRPRDQVLLQLRK